jgi:hypothetical protein
LLRERDDVGVGEVREVENLRHAVVRGQESGVSGVRFQDLGFP